MKSLSLWAKHHTQEARIIIIFTKFILAFLAFVVGKNLLSAGVLLPDMMSFLVVFLFFVTALLYPSRKKYSDKNKFYIHQKICDFLLPLFTFLMIVCFANRTNSFLPFANVQETQASSFSSVNPNEPPTAAEIIKSLKEGRDKKTLTRQEKRILKKEFKSQMKIFAAATLSGDKEAAKRTWLTIAVIIGALGLTLLLASLSCSISCGGADGLAIAVAAVGLAGIIWGTIVLLKRINRTKQTDSISP